MCDSFEEYQNINIEKVCRLCLCDNNNMQCLFKENFIRYLKELAHVDIDESDALPKLLCEKCALEVNKWYKFKLKIVKNDYILRSLIGKRKISDDKILICTQTGAEINNMHLCIVCNKQVKTINSLKRHMKIHSGIKPHTCPVCNQQFLEQGNLKKHLRKHQNRKEHECNDCGLKFYERNKLQIHMRKHTGEKPFKCELCTRAFATVSQVQRHMKVK